MCRRHKSAILALRSKSHIKSNVWACFSCQLHISFIRWRTFKSLLHKPFWLKVKWLPFHNRLMKLSIIGGLLQKWLIWMFIIFVSLYFVKGKSYEHSLIIYWTALVVRFKDHRHHFQYIECNTNALLKPSMAIKLSLCHFVVNKNFQLMHLVSAMGNLGDYLLSTLQGRLPLIYNSTV